MNVLANNVLANYKPETCTTPSRSGNGGLTYMTMYLFNTMRKKVARSKFGAVQMHVVCRDPGVYRSDLPGKRYASV